jgi:phenylacetate-CoA ligase
MGLNPTLDFALKYGVFGSESCTAEMRNKIEQTLKVFVTDNYGMSELIGPGVSGECEYRDGLHFSEDHFLPEIIDPITGEVLSNGEKGELVVTTLTKEALPVLRYRTRDVTTLNYDVCKCGRTGVRMLKSCGRTDDMLKIRGVNVFPTQIESALMTIPEVGAHYEIIAKRSGNSDILEVKIEVTDAISLDSYKELEVIQNKICHTLKSVIGLDIKVDLVEPLTIKRYEGKAKRVFDLRNKN